jgi:eukaryotic-like serine/threonine-protein kinase
MSEDHRVPSDFLRSGNLESAVRRLDGSLIGTAMGSYHITSLLGVGGMGEVYRAHDLKLGRDVAIKVLPPEFVTDSGRRARFEREARLLASLNHSNIGFIHGIEDADGTLALVLELIEGETLAERLAEGPIRVSEALTIARQVADALEAAHEKGIVHRDLKPANIKITPNGTVKVLDFGLAKIIDASGPAQAARNTLEGTREGAVIGTAAYMSPEQARGQAVDRRTDIWAFGCVVYEMLTGRVAFEGDTVSDTIAGIIEREPDWALLPTAVPFRIRELLQLCLVKDVRKRRQNISDVRLDIERAIDTPLPIPAAAILSAPRGRLFWKRVAVLAFLSGAITTAAIAWVLRPARSVPAIPDVDVIRFSIETPPMPTPARSLCRPTAARSRLRQKDRVVRRCSLCAQ